MTYEEIYSFLSNKNIQKKPVHTTRFIQKYQQTSSGNGTYLHKAIEDGKMIYKAEGEPDQKWHFCESWYKIKRTEKPDFEKMNVQYWCNLRCPELLLWIAEVCGQEEKVKDVVDEIIKNDEIYRDNDVVARRRMISLIRDRIEWFNIIDFIENNIRAR